MTNIFERPMTANGFTEEFEERVLQAEKETASVPFRPAADVLKELMGDMPDPQRIMDA
jgi:hypothetical protein